MSSDARHGGASREHVGGERPLGHPCLAACHTGPEQAAAQGDEGAWTVSLHCR